MDKIPVLGVFLVILLIVGAIYLFNANATTGAIVYGKCWESKDMSMETNSKLSAAGCSIEANVCKKEPYFCKHMDTYARVCCPMETCPDYPEIYC